MVKHNPNETRLRMQDGKFLERYRTLILIGILLIAAFLRCYRITQPFVDMASWRQTDMGSMTDNYYRGNWNIFLPQVSWNGPEPSYVGYEFQLTTYLTALLYHVFGPHDIIARCVVVAFSLWGICAFYLLMSRMFTQKLALLSTMILALIPGSVYFDRAFMPDSVMLSLVITSFWLLVCYLQTFRLRYLILAAFFAMLGFLTKISGIFIGIPMLYITISMLQKKGNYSGKRLAQLLIAGIAVLVPVAAYYSWAIYITKHYPPYYGAAGGYWVWKFGLQHFLQRGYFLKELKHHLIWMWTKPIIICVFLSLLVTTVEGIQRFINRKKETGADLKWTFHWWFIGIGIYYLIAALGIVNNPGNITLLSPAVAALTGMLLLRLAPWIEQVSPRYVPAFLVLGFLGLVGIIELKDRKYIFGNYDEDEYNMGIALRDASKPGDLVITATRVPGTTVAVYYSGRTGWVFPLVDRWKQSEHTNSEPIEDLSKLLREGGDWLGISKFQWALYEKENPAVLSFIKANFTLYKEDAEFFIYNAQAK